AEGRGPELARDAEVGAEVVGVELRAVERRMHEAVDLAGIDAGVGERPLDRLRRDLLRRAARRFGVVGLANAGDRDRARDVLELGRKSPVVLHAEPWRSTAPARTSGGLVPLASRRVLALAAAGPLLAEARAQRLHEVDDLARRFLELALHDGEGRLLLEVLLE